MNRKKKLGTFFFSGMIKSEINLEVTDWDEEKITNHKTLLIPLSDVFNFQFGLQSTTSHGIWFASYFYFFCSSFVYLLWDKFIRYFVSSKYSMSKVNKNRSYFRGFLVLAPCVHLFVCLFFIPFVVRIKDHIRSLHFSFPLFGWFFLHLAHMRKQRNENNVAHKKPAEWNRYRFFAWRKVYHLQQQQQQQRRQ